MDWLPNLDWRKPEEEADRASSGHSFQFSEESFIQQ